MSHLFPHRFGRLLTASLLVVPLIATAGTITTLYDTGVDSSHAVLANGSAESHYTLVGEPAGSATTLRTATTANGYPIPPWVGDDALSSWIGPNSDSSLDGPVGIYTYRTSFDLTGLGASSAIIEGLWASDDIGVDILINGLSTGQTETGFTAFHPFAITSGFVAGINTIDFIVRNTGGPTGLRVEMTGTVPEPGTVAVLAAGMMGMILVRRRRVAGPASLA